MICWRIITSWGVNSPSWFILIFYPNMRSKHKPPIVTLTTDFGTTDSYVAEMKGAILRHCPAATLVDVTHQIPPQDVVRASIILERVVAAFPPGTVHLAVVDPGVGTDRQILVAQIRQNYVVCPDNGLITGVWRRLLGKAWQITWRPRTAVSATFHGRDIMAPVAAMLAGGKSISSLGRRIADPVLLDLHSGENVRRGRVIYIDHFGNAITDLSGSAIEAGASIRIGRTRIGRLRQTYADAAVGQPIALIGSSGLVELAVRNGSAAKSLGIKLGDVVHVTPSSPSPGTPGEGWGEG
jgi:S-adenosylmethionine hydrolase